MAKSKQQKQELLDNLNQKIKDSKSLIISVFDKLPVNQDQELRQQLRHENVKYEVTKKTLLKKSFEHNKIQGLPADEWLGNISIASSEDELMSAKILSKFAQDKKDYKIIGGLLDKVWVDAAKIAELAKLPSKPELLAKTVATIKAPISGLVNVMTGNVRGLVNVLNGIKNNK